MAVGVLLAVGAGVFRYVDQHFHTPDQFHDNTIALGRNAEIREHLFGEFFDEIVRLADGDPVQDDGDTPSSLEDLLAQDEAEPLGDPVTSERIERDKAIEAVLLDVFDSDEYDVAFSQAIESTQAQVIRSADLAPEALLRDKGEILFDVRRLYQQIIPRLASNPLTADIPTAEIPADYGVFKVADRETTFDALWSVLGNGQNWRGISTLFALASLIGALVLADRRPSTAVQFGLGMVGLAVVIIVTIYLVRFIVPLLAGGSSAGPVVAVYAENLAPLVRTMINVVLLGLALAAAGGIAKFVWPDDWVYSSVSDERGLRSIMRRRGEGDAEPQPQPAAAAVPVGYPGYPQGPYGGYAPQWGPPPYPGHYPPPGYMPYPVGPYAQPAQPLPQHYQGHGQPTVPVMPIDTQGNTIDNPVVGDDAVPPAAPPLDSDDPLPSDAARVLPRVVAGDPAGSSRDGSGSAGSSRDGSGSAGSSRDGSGSAGSSRDGSGSAGSSRDGSGSEHVRADDVEGATASPVDRDDSASETSRKPRRNEGTWAGDQDW